MLYQLWLVKLFGVFAIPFFFYDLEILFFISSFLFLHLSSGLKTILRDYFHDLNLVAIILIFLRLLNLQFLRYTLEFFL
uniref:Succinate:cytochrome c oxidoreductase subunit 4 n=1 Tax=Porolithon onkodes TaxID=231751 RepID=A0A2Z2KVN5_9FLOR|nr:succinate:cytochrome c oxidoreductase subunit 4 [Porolithon onkodes]ASB29837.1 succinate:cytochrome c oxidoreductase subunit 4 [Porolithon onkodes]